MEKAKKAFLLKQAISGFLGGILWGVLMTFLVSREGCIYYLVSGSIAFSFTAYFLGFRSWKHKQNQK